MRRTAPIVPLFVLCAFASTTAIAAAQPTPPVIHRVSLQPDTGVLTITGTGLGPDLLVTVDGQPVPQLPGASSTQLEVLAPVAVVTMPGTYRLTVVDPMRRVGDGFVVAGPTGSLIAAGSAPSGGGLGGASAAGGGVAEREATGFADGAESRAGTALLPLTVIEDSGSPYRTAVGFEALLSNQASALYNTAVGYRALQSNATGNANTATGYRALANNTTGSENTASGYTALLLNTTGTRNTAIGNQALQANTTANSNTAVGSQALRLNSTGSSNTASGSAALTNNSTGSFNTAQGDSVLAFNTTGLHNTGNGYQALRVNGTGSYNTASGSQALAAATTASFNSAYGNLALGSTTTGFSNTASGYGALYLNTTGTLNTAVGQNALVSNTTGHSNVAVGQGAGYNATTGSYNVYLGADVVGTAADANTLRIGLPYDGATGVGQNQTFIAGIRGTAVTGGEVVFVDAAGKLGSGPFSPGPDSIGSLEVINDSLTAADLAPGSVGTSEIADGAVTVAKVGFTFAGLGTNTFAGTQTIGAGNLAMPKSTATGGNLLKNGVLFLHDTGTRSTFAGALAGSLLATGTDNTATGQASLGNISAGSLNTAAGSQALFKLTTGSGNSGHGYGALSRTTSGAMNTALGYLAGDQNTVGSHNIYVGAGVAGAVADANTMRLGLPYDGATGTGQNQTFIAGIYGTQVTGPATAVYIDANGQLGTLQPPSPPPAVGGGGSAAGGPPTVAQQLQAQQDRVTTLEQLVRDQAAVLAALRAEVASLKASRPAARRP